MILGVRELWVNFGKSRPQDAVTEAPLAPAAESAREPVHDIRQRAQ
jgi:hypothetical protein